MKDFILLSLQNCRLLTITASKSKSTPKKTQINPMAIYEYYSPDNCRIYSFYAKSIPQGAKIPSCPDNANFRMEKMISSFSVTGDRIKSEESINSENFNDPRLQATMAEMEHEMAGINEENSDPRQLGRLMRKMTEMSGEKMPERIEEIMRRLEAGEDPEKLEDEFGDMIDAGEESMDVTPDKTGNNKNSNRNKKILTRDPELYDLSDFT